MDAHKIETDALCMDAALLFRRREALKKQLAEVDGEIVNARNQYRDKIRVFGFTVHHFEQACRARGLL